jgi:site-specific DNA-methyltransferase (adenine-specific)
MEIAERFIRHSTKPGAVVFDPFACTGTFLLAAAKLGRKGIGFEINPDNANIAFGRGCKHGVEE